MITMKAYSQGTETWKESTKGIPISAYNPVQALEDSTELPIGQKTTTGDERKDEPAVAVPA
jgi:hypothetical protein